jgi:hypothetical protein
VRTTVASANGSPADFRPAMMSRISVARFTAQILAR